MNSLRKMFYCLCMMLLGGACPFVWSQEDGDILKDLEGLKDPFVSQIPEPKIKPKPVVENPVVNNLPKPQDKAPVTAPVVVPPIPQEIAMPNVDSLVIKGLVWNTDKPQVIINDKVLNVGDEINGMTVIAIDKEGVVLSAKGGKASIKMSGKKTVEKQKP